MTPQELKNSILQLAIQGRLVEQNEDDPPVDLAGIRPKKTDDYEFDLPDNWELAYLESITNGIPSKQYQILESEVQKTGQFPVISQSKEYSIGFTDEGEKAYHHDRPVVIFGDHTTEVKYVEFDFVVGADGVKIFEPIYEILTAEYLYYVLQFYSKDLSKVGGYSRHYKFIKNRPVPIPPLAEQKRIVAKIEKLLPYIDRYEQAWSRLEDFNQCFPDGMKRSILQLAIQGRLVEQRPEEGSAASLLKAIEKDRSEQINTRQAKANRKTKPISDEDILFEIPENWIWIRFGNLVNYSMGKTPPRAETQWWGEGLPWVAIADMPESGHVKQAKESVTAIAVSEKFGNRISKAGTLLMSFKLTVGRVSILDIDAVHNEAIISIYPFADHNNTIQTYLFHILPFVTQYGDSKNAIKGKTLNDTSISNLLIPLPPLAEQKRIVARLEELLPLCERLK